MEPAYSVEIRRPETPRRQVLLARLAASHLICISESQNLRIYAMLTADQEAV